MPPSTSSHPTVVIYLSGGLIEGVIADTPCRVILLDADTVGALPENLVDIDGTRMYLHDESFSPEDVMPSSVASLRHEIDRHHEKQSPATSLGPRL